MLPIIGSFQGPGGRLFEFTKNNMSTVLWLKSNYCGWSMSIGWRKLK
ncbi:hypothetical protein MtrunA17_Chr5g0446121 [Medicago truncatula]|uniref:Uncharacterized protein n=1 Tax=Medicago truncatula TaxID=3880 RepID=A0A396HXB7_MEDTR|nr:hypothetical protein MtrunA17_Chr5g0446121 [Medicago truncatula]